MLAKDGIAVTVSDLLGVAGSNKLRTMTVLEVFRARVDSQLRVLYALEAEVDEFDKMIHRRLRDEPGYCLIQRIDVIGPVLAAVFWSPSWATSDLPAFAVLMPYARKLVTVPPR
jgi:hypothetical protein